VGVILVNHERKVLLQLRHCDENYYPDYWTLPGGKIEQNESAQDAVRREVQEELSINLCNYKLFKKVVEKTGNKIVERTIYWGKIDKKIDDLKLGEGAALRYFRREEIPSLKIAFGLKPIIQEFMEKHAR